MEAQIHVGIMFAQKIHFDLKGSFKDKDTWELAAGEGYIEKSAENEYSLTMAGETKKIQLPIFWYPEDEKECFFDLKDVTIGINFHWERKEDQRFKGGLKIIAENDHLTAINVLPLEEYLKSVISSEMSATSSEELLKAHAVVSRSWLLAQIDKEILLRDKENLYSENTNKDEHIRWYDREDHANFHVCADDHCQRYQGITRATTAAVNNAIDATSGHVLTYDGKICDARYSKCCGGISEIFENVWEPVNHPYLTSVIDNDKQPDNFDIALHTEPAAQNWITQSPEAFCNTNDKDVLSQVLNDYDQETFDFFRWKKEITQDELTTLLKKRIGIDVGQIKELIPMERGTSGRLIKLKIHGTEKTVTIGKELEIRKAFSESHLYSSAIVFEPEQIQNGIPQKFVFKGAGWGHGVGLCQIGAAVMGAKGYSYQDILMHYFKGAVLEKRY